MSAWSSRHCAPSTNCTYTAWIRSQHREHRGGAGSWALRRVDPGANVAATLAPGCGTLQRGSLVASVQGTLRSELPGVHRFSDVDEIADRCLGSPSVLTTKPHDQIVEWVLP